MQQTSGRYKYKTVEPNDHRVIIVNPIHPLHKQQVTVRKIQHLRSDYVEVTVDHPDGGCVSLPLTDLISTTEAIEIDDSTINQSSFFDLKNLLRLAKLIDVKLTRLK